MKQIILVISILFFSSCSDNGSNNQNLNTSLSMPKGALTLSFDKATTPFGVVSVKATLSRIGYTPISKTVNLLSDSAAEATFDSVVIGTWKLKVDAVGNTNQILYSGQTDVTVVEGVVTQVNLVLQSVTNGVGSVKITISWGNSNTDGLVAYYPFNGNTNDASGNGFNGVVQNATLTNDRFEKPNSAYNFSGSARISFGDILDSVFCKPVAKFSISGWAKATSTGGFGRLIIGKSAGGLGPYQWDVSYINYDASCGGFSDSLAKNYQNKRISMGLNKWFHFALVFDGSMPSDQRIKFYVNSDTTLSYFLKVGNLGTTTQNTSKEITIGATVIDENNFAGSIDDIRIYNRALNIKEVQALNSAQK